mmetsp:Transcript_101872/g.288465  ORF Transcript_101872/g.288465 Transcript_101872/m.288465 type:complete len:216 (+) Transcript_101872:650-1297(+)
MLGRLLLECLREAVRPGEAVLRRLDLAVRGPDLLQLRLGARLQRLDGLQQAGHVEVRGAEVGAQLRGLGVDLLLQRLEELRGPPVVALERLRRVAQALVHPPLRVPEHAHVLVGLLESRLQLVDAGVGGTQRPLLAREVPLRALEFLPQPVYPGDLLLQRRPDPRRLVGQRALLVLEHIRPGLNLDYAVPQVLAHGLRLLRGERRELHVARGAIK